MTKLVLIDGNAILHRAYHALPPLTTKSGEPINAVYGFVSILLRIINDMKPTHLAVCFDRQERTFRKEKYVKYQAQRPVMDDFLSSQVTKMHDVLDAFSIPVYEKAGFEADDVIGTIAKQTQNLPAGRQGSKLRNQNGKINETIIVTGDRDIFQLIDKKIKVYVPVKGLKEGKLYGVEDVRREFDFDPIQMIDYKALVGDASDNYPGVSGIGPKTARDLIVKYKTVENIYKNLDMIPEKVRNKLKDSEKEALFFKNIATIVTDVPVDINFRKMGDWDMGSEDAVRLFMSYGFKTLLTRVLGNSAEKKTEVSERKEEVKNINKKAESNQTRLF
jgi:DNA polymerase-1